MTAWKWFSKEEVASWPEGHKKCRECQRLLPLSAFHKQKQTLLGVNPDCKECRNPRSKDAWQKNRHNIEANLLNAAKGRARKKNLPLSITIDDIVVPEVCPVLGIPLYLDPVKPHYHSPSLDRKIPELGYIPGNVVVMSNKANILKHNATAKEARMLADWMEVNCNWITIHPAVIQS